MKIPFVDLKAQYFGIKEEIDSAIASVISETAFIGGLPVSQFEQAFSEAYGVKHCISVANGTDSLYIIMKMMGFGQGDEVITVANSWISSSETISQVGARPVFIDIHPEFYSIDEKLIEEKINSRTKAILVVHLQGQMCEMATISTLCEKYGLFLIEDCAQSHFSEYRGQRAGTFGQAASFSFYPGKNLGAYGDAGCILTNSDDLARKYCLFARHGALKKHEHEIEGINSRMDGLQAAVLLAKLPHIYRWTEQRIRNADLYDLCLSNVGDIIIPKRRENSKHTFHLYVIRSNFRNELASFLREHGVETAIHYPRALPNLPAYAYLEYTPEDFPIASLYQKQILSLPMYPELSESAIGYVAECIKTFFKK